MNFSARWVYTPAPRPKTVCRNCFKPRQEHFKNKCMFASTDWEPMFRYEYQKWFEATNPWFTLNTVTGRLSSK